MLCRGATRYTTIELFSSSLTAKTGMKKMLEILCAANEFDSLPIRQREDEQLKRIANHVRPRGSTATPLPPARARLPARQSTPARACHRMAGLAWLAPPTRASRVPWHSSGTPPALAGWLAG